MKIFFFNNIKSTIFIKQIIFFARVDVLTLLKQHESTHHMPKQTNYPKTKFFRPQPALDYVEQYSLHPKSNKMRLVPIMLVSASTVYDKSTLVATYFLKSDKKCACLSLGSKENEINQFIQNFLRPFKPRYVKLEMIFWNWHLNLLQA